MRLPNNFITKYATPKTNITACLECGSYHEIGTICGKCYEKVKMETKNIQDQIFDKDEFKYNYPTKEIKIVYSNEEKELPKEENKVIIEIPRERPSWFSKNLLTKVSTK